MHHKQQHMSGDDAQAAIAHVLPLGTSRMRQSLRAGLAAVLISTEGAARLPAIEVLIAKSEMTVSKAGEAQDITPVALWKLLSRAFGKTVVASKAILSAFANRLRMPLRRLALVSEASGIASLQAGA